MAWQPRLSKGWLHREASSLPCPSISIPAVFLGAGQQASRMFWDLQALSLPMKPYLGSFQVTPEVQR